MKKIFTFISIVILLSAGCSSDETVKKNVDEIENGEIVSEELNVEFSGVYCWINLMPGPKAEPRFNITGEIKLFESPEYSLDSIILSAINIYQNSKLIYSIDPVIRIDDNLSTDQMKFIIFSTIKGMLIDVNLDSETVVDASFIFEQDNEKYSYLVKDIKIDKAY